MKRRAFTLVETMMATGFALLLLGVVAQLLISGGRLMASGVSAARGPEAEILLMDRLEEDALQCLQIPGDPRPPMRVSYPQRLTFYRTSAGHSSPAVQVGVPVSWSLTPAGPDRFHPTRNGVPLKTVEVSSWELELLPPDRESVRPGWFLTIRATFPAANRMGREYLAERLIHLPQPSTNFLHFLAFGAELETGAVRMVPPPPRDSGFHGLGPPG